MDRILIILKKENGPRASSAPALGLNTIIFKYVYWYMKQISGERLQDHWSSGILFAIAAAFSVVPCGGPKKSPRTSSIVQIIFLFMSFEISKDIQSVQNTHVYKHTSKQCLNYLTPFDLDFSRKFFEITVQ